MKGSNCRLFIGGEEIGTCEKSDISIPGGNEIEIRGTFDPLPIEYEVGKSYYFRFGADIILAECVGVRGSGSSKEYQFITVRQVCEADLPYEATISAERREAGDY